MTVVATAGALTGWDAVEDGIQKWIRSSTGLADGQVIAGDQGDDRPVPTFVEFEFQDVSTVGHDWDVYDDAPDPVAGAELRKRTRGFRTATMQLRCVAPKGSGSSPLRYLEQCVSGLTAFVYALDRSGVGVGQIGRIQKIPTDRPILEVVATIDVTVHLASELESRETYIERVQATISPKNPSGTDLSNQTVWTPDPPP